MPKVALALSAADWRLLLDVNLIAPWLLCTAAVPAPRESKDAS